MFAMISILIFALTLLPTINPPVPQNIQIQTGSVCSRQYIEEDDIVQTTIQTKGGEVFLNDYTAPTGSAILLLLDNNGTATLEDDNILYAIAITNFNQKEAL